MKRILILMSAAMMSMLMSNACNDLKQGTVDLDLPSEKEEGLVIPDKFVHPGLLHTAEDVERWREIVANQEQPAYICYEKFAADAHSKSNYPLQGPYKEIYRGTYDGKQAIQSNYESDFNAAYQNSVMYAVTGDESHAKKAVEILNAYANTLKAIVGNDPTLLAGIMGVKFMYAAEMMRYLYPQGMTDDAFAKVCAMFRNVFVPVLEEFMAKPAYSNGNWGASVGMSYIAAGVLFDDKVMYEKGVKFYQYGNDNGTIYNYVDGETGQCQESGRDQAHVQLGLACLSVSCEIAWNQGTDLYGVDDNRLMKGFEYTARYNVGHNDLPYKVWKDVTGKYCNWQTISEDKRGQFRPVFEMPYNHYVNRKGLSMPNTAEVLEKIRPEGYYYEHFGFGTFLFSDKK